MNNRVSTIGWTAAPDTVARRDLVDALEAYLSALEQGAAPDQEAFLASYPELADELRPYLQSLWMLHGATHDLRSEKLRSNEASGEPPTSPARQIGDYRIVREIGRGGMGVVYEAHQLSLNRRVALKILPFAAVLDQRQIARFRNEAQAAAQLHHPHIVPVFAVGQEQGVYYYAMQYVDGQSLEQAIEGMRREAEEFQQRSTKVAGTANGVTSTLSLANGVAPHRSFQHGDFFRTVARLGKEAAEALQHAHEYGIVHRDVKPSNLLIDDQGKLWVTDFGLARMQADSGVTLTGDVVGTLRYMSPEQASGKSALVDSRSDVYSLGATLYELLTRHYAFPGDDRHRLLQQIVNEEPIPVRRQNPAVPVDLETIVLGAMAKSRDERYASAQALADDLERFLTGKPTHARRPNLADRAAKWARRHRSLVATAACAVALLCVVSAAGVAMLAREQARTAAALRQAEQNARTAEKNLLRAERHYQQARDVVDQLGVRMADRLVDIPGAEPIRQALLADTLGYYGKFAAEAGDDPQLKHESALAHFKSAVIANKLGATADAIKEYESARKLLAELATNDSTVELRGQLAATHNNLGLLLAAKGDAKAGHRHYEQAIETQQRLAALHPNQPELSIQLAESQANLGMLLEQMGDDQGAEEKLRAAVESLRSAARDGNLQYARNLAMACNNLSFVVRKRDVPAAEKLAREAITVLEQLAAQHSAVSYQDDLALCCNNLAALLGQSEREDEAIQWHQRAVALQEQLVRKAPAVVRHRSDLAVTLNNLGMAYCRADRSADADDAFGRARELFSTLAGDYPDELAYRSSLAALLNNQAVALADAGRHQDALVIYGPAIDSQRECLQRLPDSSLLRELLSKMYYNYAESLRAADDTRRAVEVALLRRELWTGDGDRLFGVAVELAATDLKSTQVDDEIVATLSAALDAGWPNGADLREDQRFARLKSDDRFVALLARMPSADRRGLP